MIQSTKGIIVRVDPDQKDEVIVGGRALMIPNLYISNYRERSPVVAVVVKGNRQVKAGAVLVTHHNHFSGESQYHLGDDLYSIRVDKSVFFEVDQNGDPIPMGGNIICERVEKNDMILDIPPSMKKNYNDRVIVLKDSCGFHKGDFVITYPFSDYEVVYNWGGTMRRVVKVFHEDICAVMRNNLDSGKNV